jgi:hypothetical protein
MIAFDEIRKERDRLSQDISNLRRKHDRDAMTDDDWETLDTWCGVRVGLTLALKLLRREQRAQKTNKSKI